MPPFQKGQRPPKKGERVAVLAAPPPPSSGAKVKAVNLDEIAAKVVAIVQRQLGREALSRLGDKGAYPEIKHVVPTGLPSLDDRVLGCGGIPLGKRISIFGPESVGKTTICKFFAACCQRAGVLPSVEDVEQSGVLAYDEGLGIRPMAATGSQPDTLEEVFERITATAEAMEKVGTLGCIFFDSVAAAMLAAELARGYDEDGFGAERAKFLAQNLPKLAACLKSGRVGLVFVNQVRDVIGATQYQKKTHEPGGRALRHWAHIRLELSHMGPIKEGDRIVGIKTKVKAVKNKLAIPYQETVLELRFDPPRILEAGAAPQRTPFNPHSDQRGNTR